MKKVVFIIATLGLTFQGMAQEKMVVSALTSLKSNNFDEAKEDIDKAIANPETRESPKALMAKAQIYFTLQNVDKFKNSDPYKEGLQALFKLVEVKPDYKRADVDQYLEFAWRILFNEGAKANNDKKLAEAAELMKYVVKIHGLEDGKRFEKMEKGKKAQFDTVSAEASLIIANSAYYVGKYEEAIPLLIAVKNNPITKSAPVYACLVDAYKKQKDSKQEIATIDEGRKAFPDDATLRNYELNYYIQSGKQDEIIKKLEDAAVKEPNNSDILFNIATTYLGMANPKSGPKPANAAELIAKSEDGFQRALKLAPENAGYNYNFGALYFNQATDVNDQMNAITGTTAADQKKYDDLKAKRDGFFSKSTPYFEKAYSALSVNESTLKGEDLRTYKSTLMALKEVYARQNKMDKSDEMKKKYNSLQ